MKTSLRIDQHETTGDWIVKVILELSVGHHITLVSGSDPDKEIAASWALHNFEIAITRTRKILADFGARADDEMMTKMLQRQREIREQRAKKGTP